MAKKKLKISGTSRGKNMGQGILNGTSAGRRPPLEYKRPNKKKPLNIFI